MASVNKVIVLGFVGKDPDVFYTKTGAAITSLSVATKESWKDKDGEKQEKTEWHRIKFFGKLAEIAGEYVKKGSQLYVEGALQTEKYTDKDGVEKFTTVIVGKDLQLFRADSEAKGSRDRPAKPAQSAETNRTRPAKPERASQPDFDDDIPF